MISEFLPAESSNVKNNTTTTKLHRILVSAYASCIGGRDFPSRQICPKGVGLSNRSTQRLSDASLPILYPPHPTLLTLDHEDYMMAQICERGDTPFRT